MFLALLLGACSTPEEESSTPPRALVDASPETDRDDGRESVAAELIERGEYEAARDAIDELLLQTFLPEARRALEAGSPEEALARVDKALESDPESPEARLLKADASLLLAEKTLAQQGWSGLSASQVRSLTEGALGDALEYYRLAGESPQTSYGASRAAWLLGDAEKSLELARRGFELSRRPGEPPPRLPILPERIHAEAACRAHAEARASGAAATAELFLESEDALMRLLGRETCDAWAWRELADLYESGGKLTEARGVLERAIERLDAAPELLERLARVTDALAGPGATVEAFSRYVEAHPGLAAGRWHLALGRFRLALARFQETPRVVEPQAFSAAEEDFRRARELDPSLAENARGHEVACRLARGWCAFEVGDLAAARREFLSMNELFERAIEWSVPGELEDGIQGLRRLAEAHHAREDWRSTGELFETLLELQPGVVRWASEAGQNLREAAYDLELEGQRLCRASGATAGSPEALAEARALAGLGQELAGQGPGPGPTGGGSAEERALLARAAEERFERARHLIDRSWAAYRRAVELAPDDLGIVNDAANVLVHYLHRDLELAEASLRRCIARGEEELDAREAELAATGDAARAGALEAEIYELRVTWGDAYQNLGVLLFVHRGDAAAAIPLLERAVEIGPDRPDVVNSLLPLVRGRRELEVDDPWALLDWGRPCESRWKQ